MSVLPFARQSQTGFTLIELVVTIAIAAVLMAVAAPSFIGFQRNSELTSVTNSLISATNAARAEAMKTGMNAFVVPTANGNDWSAG
nr:prepilin-type N-terminal cleavage/methylation domain-containing protein [Acidovorax sp.]